MSDFTYLKESSVEQATAWLDMPHVRNRPRLKLRPLTIDNREWFEHALAVAQGDAVQAMAGAAKSYAGIAEASLANAGHVSKFCLVDWEGVVDAEGKLVPFTPEEGAAFLKSIAQQASWMIHGRIMPFVNNAANFVREYERTIDERAVAKNS